MQFAVIVQGLLQEPLPDMIDNLREDTCACVVVVVGGLPIGNNHVIHLNNANLLITGTRWTSKVVVHRQCPILNQFAIVDTNYTASRKVNHLTWFDLQQLRTIIFIYYPETYHLFVLMQLIRIGRTCYYTRTVDSFAHVVSFFPFSLKITKSSN